MLDPIQLRTLQCVLQHGSFRQAAIELGYTASAVSQQIASLERSVGFKLFDRLSKSIQPTDGALFLTRKSSTAIAILDELDAAIGDYRRAASGRLKIGSFGSANARFLPRSIAAVRAESPTAELILDQVRPADVVTALTNYELDIVINYQYETAEFDQAPLETTLLMHERVHALISSSHPLAGREEIALADLADESWIAAEESTYAPQALRHLCAAEGFEPKITFNSNDYRLVLAMVAEGLGVGFVPLVDGSLPDTVCVPNIRGFSSYRYVVAQTLRGTTNPLVPVFISHLKAAGRDYLRQSSTELR